MECAVYYCDYRTVAHLGKEWRPVDCGMVMSYAPEARRVDIQVDPDRMDAWRKEPFFTQIKLIAENALRGQGYLIVWQGNEAIAVLPTLVDDGLNAAMKLLHTRADTEET